MSNSKKPGDETLQGAPPFGSSPTGTDPGVRQSGQTIRVPGKGGPSDSFVGAKPPTTGSRPAVGNETAPEVSQGAWRERAFTPRAVMPPAEIIAGLEGALRVCLTTVSHPRVAFEEVRRAWLPFLRQALEQGGGDGLDVWLLRRLQSTGRVALERLWDELVAALGRLRTARDVAHFEEEALKAIELVRTGLTPGALPLRKISFKQLEKLLEGKLEVDELLLLAAATDEELTRRLQEIGATMEQLRDQIRTRPGNQPDGMYANFVRLKTEARVIDADLNFRKKSSQS